MERKNKKKPRIQEARIRPQVMTISFNETCKRLKERDHFLMVFNGLDDDADTYATILTDNPWIGKEFVTPDREERHLLLIQKNGRSKDLLVHYPRECNNRLVIDVDKWNDLMVVVFNPDNPLIEITVRNEERIRMVELFKKQPHYFLQELVEESGN